YERRPTSVAFPCAPLFRTSSRSSTCSQEIGCVSTSSLYVCPDALSGTIVPRRRRASSACTVTRAPSAERDDQVPIGTSSTRPFRSVEHTSELQSRENLVCR